MKRRNGNLIIFNASPNWPFPISRIYWIEVITIKLKFSLVVSWQFNWFTMSTPEWHCAFAKDQSVSFADESSEIPRAVFQSRQSQDSSHALDNIIFRYSTRRRRILRRPAISGCSGVINCFKWIYMLHVFASALLETINRIINGAIIFSFGRVFGAEKYLDGDELVDGELWWLEIGNWHRRMRRLQWIILVILVIFEFCKFQHLYVW